MPEQVHKTEQTNKSGPKLGTQPTKPKSAARRLQESVEQTDLKQTHVIPVVLRFVGSDDPDVHLELTPDAIYAILDPDVPDTFIKIASDMPNSLKHRYIHTRVIKELLYNQDLPERGA